MITVKNLTNSPIDMPTSGGNVWIPAHSEATGAFAGDYYDLMITVQAIEVVSSQQKTTEVVSDLEKLRADYSDLAGKPADVRWKEKRLQSEIDKMLA